MLRCPPSWIFSHLYCQGCLAPSTILGYFCGCQSYLALLLTFSTERKGRTIILPLDMQHSPLTVMKKTHSKLACQVILSIAQIKHWSSFFGKKCRILVLMKTRDLHRNHRCMNTPKHLNGCGKKFPPSFFSLLPFPNSLVLNENLELHSEWTLFYLFR